MNNKISNVLKSELINTAEMLAVFYALENDNVRSLTSEKPNIAYLVVDVLYFHSPDLGSEFHGPNMDSDIYKFGYISYSILACKLTHHFSA